MISISLFYNRYIFKYYQYLKKSIIKNSFSGAHSLLEWALSTAEASVTFAAVTAAPFVAAPLAAGDAKVAAVIDELERRVPLVTEQPKVIVETTKQAVLAKITPQLNKVSTFNI